MELSRLEENNDVCLLFARARTQSDADTTAPASDTLTLRVARMIFSAFLRCPSSLSPMSFGVCDGARDLDLDLDLSLLTLTERFACRLTHRRQEKAT